jgi:beta-glucosidase/6-phospho-beta-glucosidase/beta-galactosidase
MARLGLDAFRVHVWDTEVSDTAGNLLANEHLRLFDFLLSELKKRNIKIIITPNRFLGKWLSRKRRSYSWIFKKIWKRKSNNE